MRGHNALIPALEIAAAGGHNLYLHGPPGTGKTMLARRLPSILPPLSPAEAIEVTRIQSVAGLHHGGGLMTVRPFRAPHHTISAAGLVGGGSHPTPGEATLAHHGVLFLDELSEFARPSLEALRQPLEDGHVTIVRGQKVMAFPTRFMLVAASNPCPCGMGDEDCRCSAADLSRHHRRLSGPLLDRIDVLIGVGRPAGEALRTQEAPSSAAVRERVVAARERQADRLAAHGLACNAQMSARVLREHAAATPSALRLLYELHDRHRLSARGHGRVLRVARTVADLEGSDSVGPEHVTLADRPPPRGGSAGGGGVTACDACLRRTALIAGLSGHLDVEWRKRQVTARVLALPDDELLDIGTAAVRRAYEGFDAQQARAAAERAGLTLVCRCDEVAYPAGLRELADPPAVLHVAGTLPGADAHDAVAIVGARRATAYGLEVARALGRGLSAAGVPVVSGLALGVDSASHEGAWRPPAR